MFLGLGQTLLSTCVFPWRRQLSCTYSTNKITALAQGHRRQSWEEGHQESAVQPQHFAEDKQPSVCHAQPTSAPRSSLGAAPVLGRVFSGAMLALEALAVLQREISVGGVVSNQQNVLCSPSQDVSRCKAFNLGMHLHGALLAALLLWTRALL